MENIHLKWDPINKLYRGVKFNNSLGGLELTSYFYHKSEEHGANFYELVKEIQTKVNDYWKTFVIYKQLGSGLEFSREKEEFYNKFKQVYV